MQLNNAFENVLR